MLNFRMSMLRLISDERILERETKISRMETEDRHNPAPQKSVGAGSRNLLRQPSRESGTLLEAV